MAKVNRYSQISRPTVVNPISFEEFTRVPMAEKQAEAEGLRAVSNIGTYYNVDQKDLEDVQNAVSVIDEQKDNLINSIMDEGVTNQTISKFMTVKQGRDKVYKEYIDKAQRNKMAIDQWRQSVDKMYGPVDPSYAELVKQKGYAAWKGTMQETPEGIAYKDFEPHFGVKYWHVDEDIQDVMSKAGKDIRDLKEAHKDSFIAPNKLTGGFDIYDASGKIITSNFPQLSAAVAMLKKEYSSEDTERGRFAKYTGLNMDKLATKLNYYADIFSEYGERPYGGGRHSIAGSKQQQQNQITPVGTSTEAEVSYPVGLDFTDRTWTGRKSKVIGKTQAEITGRGFSGYKDWLTKKMTGQTPKEFKEELNRLQSKTNKTPEEDKRLKSMYKTIEKRATGQIVMEGLNLIFPGMIDNLVIAYSALTEGKPPDLKKKQQVIEHFKGAGEYLKRNNLITPDILKRYNEGDEKATNIVYDLITDHVDKLSKVKGRYKVFEGQTLAQLFGEKTDKVRNKIKEDVVANFWSTPVYNLKNRSEELNKSDKEEILQGIKEGTIKPRAILPVGSDLSTGPDSKLIEGLQEGYVFQDDDGTEYIIGRSWERNDRGQVGQNFRKGLELAKYIQNTPYDVSIPVKFNTPDNQQLDAFFVRSSGSNEKVLIVPGYDKALNFEDYIGYIEAPENAENIKRAVWQRIKDLNKQD